MVYTGTSGNLTLVFANDDNAAICGPGFRSYGTFTANGTDTYFITIEGFSFGNTGFYYMSVTCVASCTPAQTNQDCASAIALTVDGIATTVDNTCATLNPNTVTCEMFNPIADIWYTFVAPVSGEVDIETTTLTGTATQANITVYNGSCGTLAELDCQKNSGGGETVILTELTTGNTYYLQLWNSGTEEGTFDVSLTDGTFLLVIMKTKMHLPISLIQ